MKCDFAVRVSARSISAVLRRLSALIVLSLGFAAPVLANTFNVDVGTDNGQDPTITNHCAEMGNTAHCGLRAAIEIGNELAGDHTIVFSPLLVVTLSNGGFPTMMAKFTVLGNGATLNGNGLDCLELTDAGTPGPPINHDKGATGSSIANLTVGNCGSDGISLSGHGYTLTGNHIGVDATGTTAMPNHGYGISISAPLPYDAQFISVSGLQGFFDAFPVQPVDATQISSFSVNLAAVLASFNPNTITGNVISGNDNDGLFIFSESLAGTFVSGNMIGTDITGTIAIPNGGNGINMTGSTFGNLIGPNNVISGNAMNGIMAGAGSVFLPNFIMGNRIGLSSTVGNFIGNGLSGIVVDTNPDTTPQHFNPSMIGLIIGPSNLISGNKGANNNAFPDVLGADSAGIVITGSSKSIKVTGNTIGLAEFPAGTPLATTLYGNAGDGIIVTTSGNSLSSNIVAGNARHGIVVKGSATTDTNILGNSIGVHPQLAGNLGLGNGVDGIHVDAASSTSVGGPNATDFNTIAGNGRNGYKIRNGGTNNGWSNLSQRNLIYGNNKALISLGAAGIDHDFLENATDPLHPENPANEVNLDQAPAVICLGPADTGACAGSTAPASSAGSTTLQWTIATHGPADFRMEFFQINTADDNTATSMTFLGEQLVSTDLTGSLSGSGCSATVCSVTLPAPTGGSFVLMTATDISQLTDQPGGGSDWKSNLKCFAGDLTGGTFGILPQCLVNDTSEFSNVVSIPVSPASAITDPATAITTTTATLNGTVNDNGATTAVSFEYGADTSYGSTVAATPASLPSGSGDSAVTAALSGLTCATTYHFRVDANNGVGGTINGGDLTFTTAACAAAAPTATTTAATVITKTTATLNGLVSANGAQTGVSFEYGLNTTYGSSGNAAQTPLSSGSSNAPVSLAITGLVCATTYHFRVDANNGVGGPVTGNDLTFTTAACAASAPTATTAAATGVGATAATLNGTVSANGATTTVTFEYGLTTAYGGIGSPVTAPQSPISSGSSNAAVSAALSALTCNTTYHFRVDANNGSGGTVNGSDQTFTTLACAATATTVAATNITATTATINGTVSANGAATTVTFEYGTTNAYGGAGSPLAATPGTLPVGSTNAAVSAALSGLTCATTYHFRVDANNGATSTGTDLTFTTAACVASAPTVTTSAATSIITTGATLNGTVSANGASTTVSFEYGTTTLYGGTIAAAQSPLSSGAANVAVSAALAGLICNTTYHFRVDADNGAAGSPVNGNDQTFTTSACPALAPTATTAAASAITTTTATLNGNVTANGASTTVAFEYGTTAAYGAAGSPKAATQSPLAAAANNAAVSVALTGLTCNTTYHFRAEANNGVGSTVNGNDLTFTTSACPAAAPVATTTAATSITTTSASLNGTVSANGATTTVTFEYGTSTAYGTTVTAVPGSLPGASVAAPVSFALSGLTCNTAYHFRVDANNGIGGTINGSDIAFVTAACAATPPSATTTAASALTATTATLNGTISANGATTAASFEYGTTTAYGSTVSAVPASLPSGSVGTPVSAALSTLSCNTTYHFRVDANNGVGGTINGGDMSFTTTACPSVPPSATTVAATNLTPSSATLNGTVTANGAATAVTFDYGLTTAYGSSIAATQSPLPAGASNAPVSASLAGLNCATTYHFRVDANNGAGGTINGGDLSFTTAACSGAVKTFSGTTFTGSGTATAVLSGGGASCSLSNPAFVGAPVAAPSGVTFPDGLFQFSATGCSGSITVTVTFPTAFSAGEQYWKYGPTPGPVAAHWYTLGAGNSLVLSGKTAVFAIADGGLGDDDLSVNGTIVDQGGPGVPPGGGGTGQAAVPAPALDWRGLLILLSTIAVAGAAITKKRGISRH